MSSNGWTPSDRTPSDHTPRRTHAYLAFRRTPKAEREFGGFEAGEWDDRSVTVRSAPPKPAAPPVGRSGISDPAEQPPPQQR